jgi:phosphatidylglycerol:prolipoprotein diacylglycerol transferase
MSVITVTFLSPALIGLALVVALALAALVPAPWRRAWVVVLGGAVIAGLGAVAGLVPWLGVLHLTGYSVMLVLAFVAPYVAMMRRAREIGIPERTLIDIALVALIGGMVGSRIGEAIEQWPAFGRDAAGRPLPWGDLLVKALDFDGGGMVWYGGVILAGVLVALLAWQRRLRVLEVADLILPMVLLGLAFGRVGCFLNGCCYGLPTALPWGVRSPAGACTHPTQLYESLACLMLFAATFWWWRHRRWQGEISLLVVIGYAAWRFVNESLRGDTVPTSFLGLTTVTTSQAVGLYLVAAAAVATAAVVWHRRTHPAAARRAREVPGSVHHQSSTQVAAPAADNDGPVRG